MGVFQFPVTREPHLATIRDKTRCSGLTSVRFLSDGLLVLCDFNERNAYLVELNGEEIKLLDTHPTIVSDGTSVETDLMDGSGNRFVVTNFYQGSISFYEVQDLKISFVRELSHNKFSNLHGVRYIPSAPGLLWLTYCGKNNKCHQIVDAETGSVVHHFDTDQQCQDVAFIDNKAVVFARTDHILGGARKARLFSHKRTMFATAYIYEIDPAMEKSPVLVGRWEGEGHIDACKEYKGEIYAANQYLDRIDVFGFEGGRDFKLLRSIYGAAMPHGLDVRNDLLLVTNYADQTLRTFCLPGNG